MSDEATFDVEGNVNKQNCRYWSEAPPQWVREREQHPAAVIVWCAVSMKGVLGPYFFDRKVTAARYGKMLEKGFALAKALQRHGIATRRAWFQQDGATPHTARFSLQILGNMFPCSHVVSKGCAVPWPPRSPDFTVPDFFLWGYVKSLVYQRPVHSVAALKARIRRC